MGWSFSVIHAFNRDDRNHRPVTSQEWHINYLRKQCISFGKKITDPELWSSCNICLGWNPIWRLLPSANQYQRGKLGLVRWSDFETTLKYNKRHIINTDSIFMGARGAKTRVFMTVPYFGGTRHSEYGLRSQTRASRKCKGRWINTSLSCGNGSIPTAEINSATNSQYFARTLQYHRSLLGLYTSVLRRSLTSILLQPKASSTSFACLPKFN